MDVAMQEGAPSVASGVFRFWTFDSSDLLIEIMRRLGVDAWKEVEDFSPKGIRGSKRLGELAAGRCFAALVGTTATLSDATIETMLEVSPFDTRFPMIDWLADLPRDRSRYRRSIASRISAIYLRDVREYPSTLTVHFRPAAAFRDFCSSIPVLLEGISGVAGAGFVSSGGYVLPPDSLATRIEQTHELRIKVDYHYPVVYLPESSALSSTKGLSIVDGDLSLVADHSPLPDGILINPISDTAYRKLMSERGVFETGEGVLILGDRSDHPLHQTALAFFAATGRALCPLADGTLGSSIGIPKAKRPLMLVSVERCQQLSAWIAVYAASLRDGLAREQIAEGLIGAISAHDAALGLSVTGILRDLRG